MAHSGRWRFPARPGSGGSGRRGLGGCRIRVPALRSPRPDPAAGGGGRGGGRGGGGPAEGAKAAAGSGGGGTGGASSSSSSSPSPPPPPVSPFPPPSSAVAPGFDAALQVSAAIGINLRRFRAACGSEPGGGGGEDEQFLGFGSDDEAKGQSPAKSPTAKAGARKPRGRPRSNLDRNSIALPESIPEYSPSSKSEPMLMEKVKKKELKGSEKRRGRPPALSNMKFKFTRKEGLPEAQKGDKEEKENLKKIKRAPSTAFQHAAKIKKLRAGKLSPLKSQFKPSKLQIGRKGVQIVRRRGRPPTSDRALKAAPALVVSSQLEKAQRVRKEKEGMSPLPKDAKAPAVRQSPRRPVRIIPSSKRTDTTIAKQLLQRAKKGAQKKIEKEAAKLQGRKGRTQLKNIRQFIMPVVSAISSRIIKTPKRFIEDEDYDPPIKIARLESNPNSRFSATSCESSEKSSGASQHSSQMSSDSSRSSSPSVDTSSDSQASEEVQALSEECGNTPAAQPPLPVSLSPENESGERRKRRRRRRRRKRRVLSLAEGNFVPKPAKKLTGLQSMSQTQHLPLPATSSSSSPPPPLLTPPPPLQPAAGISDHAPWLMPPTIPLAPAFLPPAAASSNPMQEKRKSILREPTFRWTSLKHSRSEPQYFSSAKYAKEGLIRKPVFDNFRPPPLTPEDVGFASGFSGSGATASTRLFSPLHSGTRFELHKRSPLLRAPRFTPSEAHSRIFESVTLPSSVGRSAAGGAMGSSRKRKRRVFSPIRTEPRSPSHSMRTRSGRLSTSELSTHPPPSSVSSSLASISVGSLTTSALNSTFTFPSHSLSQPGESAEKNQRSRRQEGIPSEPFSSGSPAPLFPWFTPSPQTERGKNKDKTISDSSKDKESEKGLEKERSRDREREKENKQESRKEKKKKGSEVQGSSALFPLACMAKGNSIAHEEVAVSSSTKKPVGRKKVSPTAADLVEDVPTVVLVDSAATLFKSKVPKKGRGALEKSSLELGLAAPSVEKEESPRLPATSVGLMKHASISSVLAHADKIPVTDKRVASLLKKAKAQLYKIEKSKSLKQVDQPKGQGQESDSSETSVQGPRIKHVCRRAAVALGRKRAVFPDDMPTLSALPWEEREKILSSMGNDDKSSIAGSEDAEPLAPPIKPIKPVTRNKAPQEPPVKKGRRSRRCGQCPGCQVPEDCGICTNCLDKPKFGGRNIKKQCCKMRKCQNLQWMPSKAYLQKQAKAVKKKEKKSKSSEKKESHVGKGQSEPGQKAAAAPAPQPQLAKENHVPKRATEPAWKPSEEQSKEGPPPPPPPVPFPDSKHTLPLITRKSGKQAVPPTPVPPIPPLSSGPPKKETSKTIPAEPKKKAAPLPDVAVEQSKPKKMASRPSLLVKQKPKEKEKPSPVTKPESSAFNVLSTLSNGSISRQKPLTDGVHRIRVDFKEDCEAESVWEMGGLSILTSVPITPRVVCFLCASSGHVEFVYCQVCCEPFHKFCLEDSERPFEDQLENWCCRRCKFCHVCGRQHEATKQLLECNKCRNSYHPECLGPNYPTKPTKKKKVWICTKCVRCKSCGSTTPGKGWDAQWSHDFSLCHDCAKLFAKGNFCPLCDKCYDDDDYESKMMQCGKCDRWVHSKCENLSDEMYEILSNLPESVAYTCINCTEQHPAEWRLALEKELQLSLKQVLAALFNSRTTSHLMRYRQAAKPPDLNPETEESVPSRSSPEGPDPPVLTEVSKQEEEQPLDLESVKRKMDQGSYTSVLEFSDDVVKIIQAAINADGGQPELKKANSMVKSFFIRQMERVFPWFSVKKSRFWEPNKVTPNSGMLPNAVLPPSLDHNYAQWQEREENSCAQQPPLRKKIIPAPRSKGPGEPDSPTRLYPPTPPISNSDRTQEDNPELVPPPDVEDNRQCVLCLKYGDDGGNDAGRLLYIGQNEWTHVNCALWSAEVFEDDDGSLKNVHMAVIRGKQLRCELCQRPGATVGCCLTSCTSNYHFMCSRTKNCVFLEDKKVYCQRHLDLIKGEVVPENGFEVLRRVFVDFEGISLRRRFLNGLEPANIHMMIGSMTIDCLGILNDLSDCEDKLFPIGYQCSRVYWSTTDARKRCVYTCKIMECRPPALEPDINSTVEHNDNRTIAHSLGLFPDIPTREGQVLPSVLSPSSADLPLHPQHFRALRIRTPSFSPAQRSPGSRPLPSAGSPTPVTHEIVTVGDPLLSSGLRSIGSRRPSVSPLFPQQLRSWAVPPSRAGTSHATRHSISSGPSIAPALEQASSNTKPSLGSAASCFAIQNSSSPPSFLKPALGSGGNGTPSSEGSMSSEAAPAGEPTPAKMAEKGKVLSPEDFSSSPVNSKADPLGQGLAGMETNTSRTGKLPEPTPEPLSSKDPVAFLPVHQRPPKKEKDQQADLLQPEKTCSYEDPEAKVSGPSFLPPSISDPLLSSVGKERRQKVKRGAKERHSSKLFPSSSLLPAGNQESTEPEFAHHTMTPDPVPQRLCNSIATAAAATEKAGDNSGLLGQRIPKAPFQGDTAPSKEMQASQKRTVKVTLTPLKMEGESQSKSVQRESNSESQTKESNPDPVTQSGDSCVLPEGQGTSSAPEAPGNSYPSLPVQEGSLMLQDEAKAQEEGAYKRRYPRRSARARSNMFFGLTPLYGVRSYGEEDIPFYSNSTGKKRGKRSAEGQVDGADDLSTSDEDDLYYYNFTRTVVSTTEEHLPPHSLFREEEHISLPKISQLDGVDDGTESDTSMTVTTRKGNPVTKRSSKENGTESLKESGEKVQVTKSSAGHKAAESKIENCRVKAQNQDSLEAQLSSLEAAGRRTRASTEPPEKNLLDTFSTELLKSDSDNNNSDDCGNILPSDIMDFVLKNTPSMQALGESPESSSSELLTLGEGLGLDSNRGKDMGLFEVFSQQLPNTEPVDSSVSSSISAEEQFELPLELPSDLSVLTTRSPTVPSQNHSRLAVISESSLSSTGERSILALPSTESGEKRVTVTEKPASNEGEPPLLSPRVEPAPDGPLTPDPFIQGHMESEHITSPPCGPSEPGHGASQDLSRNSGTPGLQVPVSPTLPHQNSKYGPNTAENPGPSQISNAAVQTAPLHLKAAAEKLLVVNQNMQPLYVLQTLPNGVTQKIQLTSSVGSAQGVMEAGSSMLGPMATAELALAAGLSPSLPSSQPLFPPTSKGLLPMPHHQHLHSFSAGPQGSFPPTLGSPASSLLIGVQQPPEPEASQRGEMGSSASTSPSSLSKKRPIARLQSRKNKKLAPSDMAPNMALINFTQPQLPSHPGLLNLGGSVSNSASHRPVPNIIKRSKAGGVMYFEQSPLLPQGAAVGTPPNMAGPETGHLASGPASGLPSPPSALNIVSMQTVSSPTTAMSVTGHVLGQASVALARPGLRGVSDMGPLSNLLLKATQQSLGLPEQHTAPPPSGSGIFSPLADSSTAQAATPAVAEASSSGMCILSSQTLGKATDPDSSYQSGGPLIQILASKNGAIIPQPEAPPLSHFPQLVDIANPAALEQSKTSSSSSAMQTSLAASPGSSLSTEPANSMKAKLKVKRLEPLLDSRGPGKKHKMSPFWTGSPEKEAPQRGTRVSSQDMCGRLPALKVQAEEEATSIGPPPSKAAGQLASLPEAQPVQSAPSEQEFADSRAPEDEEGTFSSPLMFLLQQEQKRKESLAERKPKKGLVFEISSDDGFQICAESIEEAWKSLTDKVQEARSNARLKQLSFAGVSGLRMLGILHDAVVFLIEQLYGAKHCHNYKFRFHKPEEAKEPPVNPHGSARAEVYLRKSAFDMFNFLASKHRQPPEYHPNDDEEEEVQLKSARRATSMDLPMPMRFRHLKKTSKEAVGVYRSPIHGRGLFCKRNIDAGEMVIEYAGNVIRSILTDKREKYYDSKDIGCYMFRIDDSEVVDATMHGNAARFINHSCEPNCYSRVINIDGQKHIVIFAMRKIYCGEELTYDYKFPIEDASNKLPCNCGAKKCRRFLN
ncbi:histone-lysine N-methyltransferase 2A isoform X2 [Sceloporus undulatus]|uniref:histone-lysine N-methyltransferase 2A isoform X2 n=1 Tax=Sceloporus undulatus TaxID=8520 RepID=UPI001C4D0E90|nr:histone-lysine N-methyltransferase 2A isoform X2 [Sceloporus undulatus]